MRSRSAIAPTTAALGLFFAMLSVSMPGTAHATPAAADAEAVAHDHPRLRQALHLLEVWVEAERAYQRLPGISMGIVHDQDLLWSHGFGFAHLESREPATSDTIYSICSISKLFTSIAVMQLRDAGKLRLDDPVGDHLPWFEIEQAFPEGPAVTVEGLLTHSAGLPRESDHHYWTGPDFPFPTREEIAARVSAQRTLYPAGRTFQYSNLGLTLAGELVAAKSDQPYDDYLRKHVLDPLGMTDTHTEVPAALAGGRLATGYGRRQREGDRAPLELFQARGIAPAAGFASTVGDLARFASWQLRLLEHGGSEVISANTLREMHRVHWVEPDWKTTWGLGFAVSRRENDTFVGHGGACPGYRSQLLLHPKSELAVVFLSNAIDVDTGLFALGAFRIVSGALEDAKKPASPPSDGAAAATTDLERFAGLYSSAWDETAIVPWKDGLAALDLPTRDPLAALTELRHVEGNVFRRVRDDGELGETVSFEEREGLVTRLLWHGNYSERLAVAGR
jgi:CubicO group peptidase (beta-lactamase class C family)